jgi:hypothetical protein
VQRHEDSSENAWVRIASSVQTPEADRLKTIGAYRHACTLEAMRTQALFIVSARCNAT